MFSTTGEKGFHITFENEVTVSVQFGKGNYCNNYNKGDWLKAKPCENAEIAIFDKNDNWITDKIINHGDDVKGYVSPDELLEYLVKAKNYQEATQC